MGRKPWKPFHGFFYFAEKEKRAMEKSEHTTLPGFIHRPLIRRSPYRE
jgi:hypothetical protein